MKINNEQRFRQPNLMWNEEKKHLSHYIALYITLALYISERQASARENQYWARRTAKTTINSQRNQNLQYSELSGRPIDFMSGRKT